MERDMSLIFIAQLRNSEYIFTIITSIGLDLFATITEINAIRKDRITCNNDPEITDIIARIDTTIYQINVIQRKFFEIFIIKN
jgi:hypothetical protein